MVREEGNRYLRKQKGVLPDISAGGNGQDAEDFTGT
jgi:hypothetical protein